MDHLKVIGASTKDSAGKDAHRQPVVSHAVVDGGRNPDTKAWPLEGSGWQGEDDDSEEHIMRAEDGIRATTEVRVEYDGEYMQGGSRSKRSTDNLDV